MDATSFHPSVLNTQYKVIITATNSMSSPCKDKHEETLSFLCVLVYQLHFLVETEPCRCGNLIKCIHINPF